MENTVTFEDVFDVIINAESTIIGDMIEEGEKYRKDHYGDIEWISKREQYGKLQNFGFSLESHNVKISQELADFLTEIYDDLQIEAEQETGIDMSGDYIMNFSRWVEGSNAPIYW